MSIGLTGLPDLPSIGVAALMVLLLPFKAAWYVLLLSRLKLRYRTALLSGLSLMNYSEFGLIVVSVGVSVGMLAEAWLVEMSIAVAMSFVVSALVNGRGHLMVEKIAARLPAQDEHQLHPEERPGDASDAEVVVIGMGRVGFAAYQRLTDHYGLRVVGVDYDGPRIDRLAAEACGSSKVTPPTCTSGISSGVRDRCASPCWRCRVTAPTSPRWNACASRGSAARSPRSRGTTTRCSGPRTTVSASPSTCMRAPGWSWPTRSPTVRPRLPRTRR